MVFFYRAFKNLAFRDTSVQTTLHFFLEIFNLLYYTKLSYEFIFNIGFVHSSLVNNLQKLDRILHRRNPELISLYC